jgi:hypothetical protein
MAAPGIATNHVVAETDTSTHNARAQCGATPLLTHSTLSHFGNTCSSSLPRALFGPPEQVAAFLDTYRAAEVSAILLMPLGPDPLPQHELLREATALLPSSAR